MEISFYLKDTQSEDPTPIYCRVCYHGRKAKVYIAEKIHPKFWNDDAQRAVSKKSFAEHPEFNLRLDNIQAAIRNVYRTYQNQNDFTIPEPDQLKKAVEERILPAKHLKKAAQEFMGYFKGMIDDSRAGIRFNHKTGKGINPNTIKTYVTVYNNLTQFEKDRKEMIRFSDIDVNFYNELNTYFLKKLNFSNNSAGKHIQVMKLVLNEATDAGINKHLKFKSKRFMVIKENTDAIYLTTDEIDELSNLDLSTHPGLDRTRDLFLIGCKTGLRFSDYTQLKPELIGSNFITIKQEKTGDPVTIPIDPLVKKIVAKYHGKLPKANTNQVTNRQLKEIGEMLPSLKKTFTTSMTKGGKLITEDVPRFELLSTHTARRSFCTNEYLAGTPALTIMSISGHQTEKAFLRYIKLKSTEHANILKSKWAERNP
jgi:integrase